MDKYGQLLEQMAEACFRLSGMVVRMSTADLLALKRGAEEKGLVLPSIPGGELPASIYGMPIEIDDSLSEPELVHREHCEATAR